MEKDFVWLASGPFNLGSHLAQDGQFQPDFPETEEKIAPRKFLQFKIREQNAQKKKTKSTAWDSSLWLPDLSGP